MVKNEGTILSDLPPLDLADLKPLAATKGNLLHQTESDHLPVSLRFAALPAGPAAARAKRRLLWSGD